MVTNSCTSHIWDARSHGIPATGASNGLFRSVFQCSHATIFIQRNILFCINYSSFLLNTTVRKFIDSFKKYVLIFLKVSCIIYEFIFMITKGALQDMRHKKGVWGLIGLGTTRLERENEEVAFGGTETLCSRKVVGGPGEKLSYGGDKWPISWPLCFRPHNSPESSPDPGWERPSQRAQVAVAGRKDTGRHIAEWHLRKPFWVDKEGPWRKGWVPVYAGWPRFAEIWALVWNVPSFSPIG